MPLDGMDSVMKRMNLDKQAIELYEAYLKKIKP